MGGQVSSQFYEKKLKGLLNGKVIPRQRTRKKRRGWRLCKKGGGGRPRENVWPDTFGVETSG